MKLSLRIIAKGGYLLVFLGFLMPIISVMTFSANGFQLLKLMGAFPAFLTILMLLSAIAGIAVGVLLYLNKNTPPVIAEWIILGVCVGSGFILFLTSIRGGYGIGAFVIFIGWIVAIAGHIMARKKGEL